MYNKKICKRGPQSQGQMRQGNPTPEDEAIGNGAPGSGAKNGAGFGRRGFGGGFRRGAQNMEQGAPQGMFNGDGPMANRDMASRHQHDQQVFHTMLEHHQHLQRHVDYLDKGIRSVTTSENPEIIALLHDHVPTMHKRMLENFPLRLWDPLYVEIFKHREKITMHIELLDKGVEVTQTSEDPWVVKLIHAHGETVSNFIRQGFAAAHQKSPMPTA